MKIVRFKDGGKIRYGVLEGNHVVEYAGTPFGTFKRGRKKYPLKQVVLLAPVLPSKVVAFGLTYRDHITEAKRMGIPVSDEPVIFLKPSTAVIGPGDPIVCPAISERVDYEGGLAIVIKKRCKQVSPERAREYILGYTALNDVTARDLQQRDVQWTRGKSFDSFCPVGPCIATDVNPNNLQIETYLNGECKQKSNTNQFIVTAERMVSLVSQIMALLPGDVIATGTPPGVGPMRPGDTVEVKIEGIGSLKNPIIKP
mgnify:CR=1 FL=1